MRKFKEIPFDTRESDRRGYQIFKDEVWHSGEVCNSCFSQVRTIGPEKSRMLEAPDEKLLEHGGPPPVMKLNEWYERTENGSQEHTTWDHNRRFGTCYCRECGTDCNGNHRQKSLDQLKPLVKNIFRYISYETDHEIDGKQFGAEVRRLKKLRDAQGYETEVMAIAFARALERPRPSARAESSASGVAVSD